MACLPPLPRGYARRRPEKGVLHHVLRGRRLAGRGPPGPAADDALRRPDHGYAPLHVTADNHAVVNDLAFFLAEAGHHDPALNLLRQVVHFAPDRTVAWLNLGDTLWAVGEEKAGRAAYQRYAAGMEADGKAARIPERLRRRGAGPTRR